MKDILSRAQKYGQLEKVMRDLTTQPLKQESEGEKTTLCSSEENLKPTQNGFKKQSQLSSSRNPVEIYGVDTGLTPFKTSIDRIFQCDPGPILAETSKTAPA